MGRVKRSDNGPSAMGIHISDQYSLIEGESFHDRSEEMTTQETNQLSADSDDLGPLVAGPFQIGALDEVNGEGGIEVPDFVPTRNELLQLVKYWERVTLEIEYFWFLYQQTGSTDIRMRPFALRRINRIADVLGEEAVKQAIEEVYEEFRKREDPRLWDIFLNGSDEDREAVASEIQTEIQRSIAETDSERQGS